MMTKWSLQFRLNETGNQSNIPIDKPKKKKKRNVAVLKNLIALLCYPIFSKFMRCLSKNKL